MDTVDITVRILEQIRDEIRTTNDRLSRMDDRLTSEIRLTRADLSTRLDSVEHVVELAQQQNGIVRYLKDHVADDLGDLRRRVAALEAKAG